MPLRIVFMGTPDFSVPALAALDRSEHSLVACYSQPPRPAGRRGLELKKNPVHVKAEELGVPVYTPENFKLTQDQELFASHASDVAVVIAYGLLLPEAILQAPRLGCYNGHASLLPRWRGAAPIQRAIMAGDLHSGVNIMKMDRGLDTGPVALSETVAIDENMNAGALHDALSDLTAELMVKAIDNLEHGSLKLTQQPDDGVTYAHKISKEETRINWACNALDVHNKIRGLSPFPGAWCEMRIGGKAQRVKILASELADGNGKACEILDDQLTIACSQGAVRIIRLQRAGKQVQDVGEFLLGNDVEAVS